MKTDALIAMLARGPIAVGSGEAERRLAVASALGFAVAALAMLAALAPRPDLSAAWHAPIFWLKLVAPLLLAGTAFAALARLGRPGDSAGLAWTAAAVVLALLWVAALLDVAAAPAAMRPALVAGSTALPCVISIAALSLPVLAALLVALRQLAPTRPRRAGAAAGLLAGGLAASIYAVHCTEMALPFLATWYVLGMALPMLMGALVARRMLRWV